MAGCRSLSEAEVELVLAKLDTPRDRALFVLGLRTGFRISELLSLKVSDVYQAGRVVDRVKVSKRNMKAKGCGREVALHPQAKALLQSLLDSTYGLAPAMPLFASRGGKVASLTRFGAHRMLKNAYAAAGLTGALATHTMRKGFAKKVYAALNHDLLGTQKALGHSSVLTTIRYLETNQDSIDAAVLA